MSRQYKIEGNLEEAGMKELDLTDECLLDIGQELGDVEIDFDELLQFEDQVQEKERGEDNWASCSSNTTLPKTKKKSHRTIKRESLAKARKAKAELRAKFNPDESQDRHANRLKAEWLIEASLPQFGKMERSTVIVKRIDLLQRYVTSQESLLMSARKREQEKRQASRQFKRMRRELL